VVRDQPGAVDLPHAIGNPHPDPGRRGPVGQCAVQTCESVPERHIVADAEGQVANLIDNGLEDLKNSRPVLEFCRYSDMLEWRLDVEGYDVGGVQLLQGYEILGSQRFDGVVDPAAELGVIRLDSIGAGPGVV